MIRVLVVGVGGLGCEVLKNIVDSGMECHIDLLDLDTVEISNLNRQFMFRLEDVSKPKVLVAVKWIHNRFPDFFERLNPVFMRLEDVSSEYLASFHIILACLDSLESRRWLNSRVVDLASNGAVIPLIDGGSEGFKGHASIVIPGVTACIECLLPLFSTAAYRPICTFSSNLDSVEKCIEWAAFIAWPREYLEDDLDLNRPEHAEWIATQSREKCLQSNITCASIEESLILSTLKQVIPALSTTNSVIAGICSLLTLRLANGKGFAANDPNFFMYNGESGAYLNNLVIERAPDCSVCRKLTKRDL